MDAIFPKPTNAVFSCIFVDINTKYLWIILSGYECRNYGEFKKTFSVHTNGDEGFCYATWIPCTISTRVILGLPHQPFHISAPKAETTSQIHTRRVTGLRETFASWLLDKLKQEKAPCAGWHSCVLPGSYWLSDGRAPLWHHGSFAHPTSGEAKM
ncbi:hypothetical protein SCLCIDRAFT_807493 [Scleroderma citrinum Foug A]|uniref:Uncharacterized protein n=1 Tax=Scleroderma citrinum Foug A TaxID=1036808 RepID=A0A0C2ZBW8_9AGAM|nr:hypothetical protein SCLCIDRAFT_807493 [Scleroderma citrinum Foug A]